MASTETNSIQLLMVPGNKVSTGKGPDEQEQMTMGPGTNGDGRYEGDAGSSLQCGV